MWSGIVSRWATPVMALDDVVEGLEVLDVDGGDHVDPGGQEGVDVLPALGVAGAGDVGVGQFVDEGDVGVAGQDGVQVHLLEAGAPVVEDLAGDDLEVGQLGGGVGPAVGLHEPDHDVGVTITAPASLVQHGVRLAHPRGRPQVDPQRTPSHLSPRGRWSRWSTLAAGQPLTAE